jgi:aminoglycoside phosphotransferase family enzyme/predicted kinase
MAPEGMTHPKLVESMMQPGFYSHGPDRVELVQTHISFIFIAADRVYKVKKAVDFGFLDFTTLEKRKHFCREELRLNRRLAPDTYLEVVEISDGGDGRLVLGKGRKTVEYAVVMKKLPQDRMLKKLLAEQSVGPSVMEGVARKLADFHRRAETGGQIDEIGGIETIRRNHDENFDQTEKYIGKILPGFQYRFLKAYVYDFMSRHRDLFLKRVADHRIRDCHGDLHLEHICLANGIIIFDCIEFNERFRYEDTAAEVAFLAMDLDFNGYPDHADRLIKTYMRDAGDPEMSVLLPFYQCYYAYVRGKVTSFRSDDPLIDGEEKIQTIVTASRYFDIAYRYAARLEKPTLIILAGLMGTGKSVLARDLEPLLGAETIRTDVLRKEMLALPATERHREGYGEGIYGEDVTVKTYERALERASESLRAGRSVIIDASFSRRDQRRRALDAAAGLGADYYIVECVCPDAVVQERLEQRSKDPAEPSDGRWEIFSAQKNNFDPITQEAEEKHLVMDTSRAGREETAGEAVRRIRAGGTG